MSIPEGYEVRAVDARNISDDDIALHNALSNVLGKERRPEEPPTSLTLATASWRNIPSFVRSWDWFVVAPDGSLAASAEIGFDGVATENLDAANIHIKVHPDHRRKGIGRSLLALIAQVSAETGRPKLFASTESVVPAGQAFAERVGADAGLVMRTSELRLDNVDRHMVARWLEEAPGRAPGYSLEQYEGAYPAEMLPEICEVLEVMNTAPRDSLEFEDEKVTPEQLVEGDRSLLARGTVRWSMFVRHDETGKLAGYTDTYWHPEKPKTVWQGGTAVDPAHRGHALGKWLKAAMVDKLLRERPEAERILTENAYTNDAMLGINNQLGFKEERQETIWQVKLPTVEAYLSS
jgi:mycothiol synthase